MAEMSQGEGCLESLGLSSVPVVLEVPVGPGRKAFPCAYRK